MMKTPLTRGLFVLGTLVTLLLGSNQVKASHAMGADLWYQCINPATNTYVVSLRFYRDCFGIDVPTTESVTINSVSCGQTIDLTLNQLACSPGNNGGIACEVSPLCPSFIGQSQCADINNPYPGVQAYTYTGTVQLPMACSDWIFSWDECCRNAAITNLLNPGGEDLYVEAKLNNLLAGYNNSPLFTTLPVPFICANQPYAYNHGAVDADGDSLVYSLVNPLSLAAPIAYSGTFTATQPMNTSPANTLTFGSSTGQMSFVPNGVQVCVIAVLVEEYRNGLLIGSTMRDIQIVVLNIPGCGVPPDFAGAIPSSVVNGYYINNSVVQVCPGSNLSFSVLSKNSTGDSVFVVSDAGISIPGSQVTSTYVSGDSVFTTVQWTPTALDTGINNLVFTVSNHNCPISSVQSFAVTINVLSGTYAGPDLSYCPVGGPVQLQVFGGTQFSWSPATGLNNPNISNPKASPAQTTTYFVTSNLSSNCNNKDTITIYRVPDFNYTLTQSKDTICRFEIVNLNVTAQPGFGPYTYHWTPSGSLDASNIPNPIAQPDYTTTYTLVITSDTGCIIHDSTARIVVTGQGPLVQITPDKLSVCQGDTIHLSTDISTLPCGLNVVPCTGNFDIQTIGTGAQLGQTPYRGLWEDGRIQMLFRASELQAMGMQAGTITDIAFDISTHASTMPYNNFNIKMGCTDQNELSTYITGLSPVLSEPSFSPAGTGFTNHNFTNPYDWDGQSNLIIEVCFDNPPQGWSNSDDVNGSPTGFSSVLYTFDDGASGCTLGNPIADQVRPNVQFVYCIAPVKNVTYSWTPTTNIYYPDSLNPFVVMNENNTYILNAWDGTCHGSGTVTLSIDTSFNISAGPDLPFCTGDPAQLQATVTGTPPTGGNLDCGVHNTACNGTPVVKTFAPAGSSSSTITLFQGSQFGQPREDQRVQVLYRASDLLAMGITKGTINQVGFNVSTKASLLPFQNLSIKMGCTFKTELTDTMWEPATVVYTSLFYGTVAGWNDFALASTFDWNGTTNIVVELCWDSPDGFLFGSEDDIMATSPVYNSFHTVVANSAVGCNMSVANSTLYQVLPDMRVKLCPPPPLPVTYEWTPATGLSSVTAANPTASPSAPTMYMLTAYFGGSCPKVDSVLVTPQNFQHLVSNDTTICQGYPVQLNSAGGNTYAWSPATGLSCSNCPNPVSTPDSSITYYLHLTDTTTGCDANDTVVINVQNLDATALFADTLVDQGTAITIGVTAVGGSGNYSYTWSPVDYLSDVHAANPVSTPIADVLYTVSVSSGPCTDTASVNVRVHIIESPVAVPNAFSPNGDGKNDGFYPVIMNNIATVKTFRIYNRYGQLVHDNNNPWDGKFKNADQPAGTFIYYIVVQRPFKEDEKLQGAFTLLR